MKKPDLDRNIASCDDMIASYDQRISRAKKTGEDESELKTLRAGYVKRRKELLDEAEKS